MNPLSKAFNWQYMLYVVFGASILCCIVALIQASRTWPLHKTPVPISYFLALKLTVAADKAWTEAYSADNASYLSGIFSQHLANIYKVRLQNLRDMHIFTKTRYKKIRLLNVVSTTQGFITTILVQQKIAMVDSKSAQVSWTNMVRETRYSFIRQENRWVVIAVNNLRPSSWVNTYHTHHGAS